MGEYSSLGNGREVFSGVDVIGGGESDSSVSEI